MSNELAVYGLSDMMKMADAVARSGLFGMKNPDQALALMLVAQSENMHPATVTQDYDIIQGKACRKTHSVMARFQQMGGKVEWHTLTDAIAEATFSHPSGGSLRLSWTFEQAKKAGLTNKDNWKNYPRAMLRARTIAEGVRSVYPAAIGGMMISEEAQDTNPAIPEEKHMGFADVIPPKNEPAPLPAYPEQLFENNLAQWELAVKAGKATPEQLIARSSTKYTLTDEQVSAINALSVKDNSGAIDAEFVRSMEGEQK